MTDRRRRKTKRSIKQKGKTYYHFYKRNGAYDFLKKNVLKLVVGLGGLALILYLVKDYLPDLDYYFELMTIKFRPITILLIFLLSESFLGLIPPDFFILWGKQFQNPYAMVGLLAALSYGGGVISYIIGVYIGKLPKVHNWLERKFLNHIDNLRKWGGVLIVFAALFPLPFSPVCAAAGMVRFPVKTFLLLGLFRFLRFFGYALVLFKVL